MEIEKIIQGDVVIAVVSGSDGTIADVQSALDLIMTVNYETQTNRVAIDKNLFVKEFFILSSGLAGEILQKFINYNIKAAIYGDYCGYTSKPLKDFIYESNQGKDIFFVPSRVEAVSRLARS